ARRGRQRCRAPHHHDVRLPRGAVAVEAAGQVVPGHPALLRHGGVVRGLRLRRHRRALRGAVHRRVPRRCPELPGGRLPLRPAGAGLRRPPYRPVPALRAGRVVMTEPATFSSDTAGLDECRRPEVVELTHGEMLDLGIAPVVKQLGDDRVRMLAYNGSVPGPTLRVRQGSEISVRCRNDGDVEATVHWHGLRLDNKSDGVPYETQEPIPIGGEYTCPVRFPDA